LPLDGGPDGGRLADALVTEDDGFVLVALVGLLVVDAGPDCAHDVGALGPYLLGQRGGLLAGEGPCCAPHLPHIGGGGIALPFGEVLNGDSERGRGHEQAKDRGERVPLHPLLNPLLNTCTTIRGGDGREGRREEGGREEGGLEGGEGRRREEEEEVGGRHVNSPRPCAQAAAAAAAAAAAVLHQQGRQGRQGQGQGRSRQPFPSGEHALDR
jgi:hypothetical protein